MNMSRAKRWLIAASVAAMLITATVVITATPAANDPVQRIVKSHWRFHDGHWSYWYEPDNAWYYTDGTYWFVYDNDAWRPYRFDRKYGRDAFERGVYVVPAPDARVTFPRFKVWIPR
jgi:hypothetical protein